MIPCLHFAANDRQLLPSLAVMRVKDTRKSDNPRFDERWGYGCEPKSQSCGGGLRNGIVGQWVDFDPLPVNQTRQFGGIRIRSKEGRRVQPHANGRNSQLIAQSARYGVSQRFSAFGIVKAHTPEVPAEMSFRDEFM